MKEEITCFPSHVAVIMDGNGRWAKKRNLPRNEGHRVGAKVFGDIVKHASKIGVKSLTAYAFSTENWKRPESEVRSIMELLERYLDDFFKNYKNNSEEDICLKVIGDISQLSKTLQEKIIKAQEQTKNHTRMTVNIAINYGSRDEIIRASKMLAEKCLSGEMKIDDICEDVVSDVMYTSGQPELDLIIRPSGEKRLSNFLLWQSAYAEFVFMDVLWPDFTTEDFDIAINEFAKRSRRFGGV